MLAIGPGIGVTFGDDQGVGAGPAVNGRYFGPRYFGPRYFGKRYFG